MVINGLTYKIIPHEVYISEKITYKDEEFLINQIIYVLECND